MCGWWGVVCEGGLPALQMHPRYPPRAQHHPPSAPEPPRWRPRLGTRSTHGAGQAGQTLRCAWLATGTRRWGSQTSGTCTWQAQWCHNGTPLTSTQAQTVDRGSSVVCRELQCVGCRERWEGMVGRGGAGARVAGSHVWGVGAPYARSSRWGQVQALSSRPNGCRRQLAGGRPQGQQGVGHRAQLQLQHTCQDPMVAHANDDGVAPGVLWLSRTQWVHGQGGGQVCVSVPVRVCEIE